MLPEPGETWVDRRRYGWTVTIASVDHEGVGFDYADGSGFMKLDVFRALYRPADFREELGSVLHAASRGLARRGA